MEVGAVVAGAISALAARGCVLHQPAGWQEATCTMADGIGLRDDEDSNLTGITAPMVVGSKGLFAPHGSDLAVVEAVFRQIPANRSTVL
jgi:hypothetical protein